MPIITLGTWLSHLEGEAQCSTCGPERERKGAAATVRARHALVATCAQFPAPSAPTPCHLWVSLLLFHTWPPQSFISQKGEVKMFII